jgi:hypothetical protein
MAVTRTVVTVDLLLWLLFTCFVLAKEDAVTSMEGHVSSSVVAPDTATVNDNVGELTDTTKNSNTIVVSCKDNDQDCSPTPSTNDLHGSEKEGIEEEEEEEEEDYDQVDDYEDHMVYKVWEETPFTLSEFEVNGINLASFGKQPLFQLYEDFDISAYIRGDEEWEELLAYRNALTRPSLSFYVDKVARKRWLPTQGYPQPKVHLLEYAEDLTQSHDRDEERNVILAALPKTGSYCAKPTHMSLTKGTWLVDHQSDGTTRYSLHGYELDDHGGKFDETVVARELAESLHDEADDIESWALKNVFPGLVVEERWSSHDEPNSPPHEFNMFTIWGRVWVGQWNTVEKSNRWNNGFIVRFN